MIVWTILIAVTVMSAMNLAFLAVNNEAGDAARRVFRTAGIQGAAAACLIPIFGFVVACLWTAYAVDVDDWRFAAIAWIPLALGMVGRIVSAGNRRVMTS